MGYLVQSNQVTILTTIKDKIRLPRSLPHQPLPGKYSFQLIELRAASAEHQGGVNSSMVSQSLQVDFASNIRRFRISRPALTHHPLVHQAFLSIARSISM